MSDEKKETSKQSHDTDDLGITFLHTEKDHDSDDIHERTPVPQNDRSLTGEPLEPRGGVHGDKDIFDVSRAYGEEGFSRGTVVTDKRRVRPTIGETLRDAFTEWWGNTSTSLSSLSKKLETFAPPEAPTVSTPETRKEVIQAAATFTKQAPRDDHAQVLKKLSEAPKEDVEAATSAFLVKPAKGDVPSWKHPTQGAETKSSPDVRSQHAELPPIPQPPRSEPTPIPVPQPAPPPQEPQLKKFDHQDSEQVNHVGLERIVDTPEPVIAVPVIPKEEQATEGVAQAEHVPSWTHLKEEDDDSPTRIATNISPQKRDPVEVPRELPRTPITRPIPPRPQNSIPAPDTQDEQEVAMKPSIKSIDDGAPRDKKPSRDTVPLERSVSTTDSEAPASQPTPEHRPTISTPPAVPHRPHTESTPPPALDAHEPVISAEPLTITTIPPRTNARVANPKTQSGHLKTTVFIVGLLIVAFVGAGLGVWMAYRSHGVNPTAQVPMVTPPSLIRADHTIPVPLIGSRLEFFESIRSALTSTGGQVTVVFIIDSQGDAIHTTAAPEQIFAKIAPTVSGGFTRSIGHMVFGSLNDGEDDPFIIVKGAGYESAFAGMLAWERTMWDDLMPLLGEQNTGPEVSTQISNRFTDAQEDGYLLRILSDKFGNERLVYGFVDRSTLIISTSRAGFVALVAKMKK